MLTVEQAAILLSDNVALSLALYVILYGLLVAIYRRFMARPLLKSRDSESEHQGDYAQRVFTQHMTAGENAHVDEHTRLLL